MIKATGVDGEGKKIVIFGLSFENIERLKAGDPISIDLAEMGMEGRAYIFAGPDEAVMQAWLTPAFGPETKIYGHKDEAKDE